MKKFKLNKAKYYVLLLLLVCGASIFVFLPKDNKTVFIEANQEKGFNYGYYYYIPKSIKNIEKVFILVEPNNTGYTSDDINVHKKSAEQLIIDKKKLVDELGCILLVPVFERPESDELMYTHALDRDTILNDTGILARIDLQLINMIDDLKELVKIKDIYVEEKILMNGFSASGNFVNRFTALHPNLIQAVASGGVNAMPILPIDSLEGETLIYPIGIEDLQEITGVAFDFESYALVPQFIYMGALDDNDTLPYSDAFDAEEREIIIKILGWDMLGRWEKSKQIYEELGCTAELVLYDGVGHEFNEDIWKDITKFFQDNIR